MPSLSENLETWGQRYPWTKGGDEWSDTWGGTEPLWWGTIFPRLRPFLPARTIVEIGPGFGRVTQYLQRFAERLQLVDLTQKCLDACRERFAKLEHLSFHRTDGSTLPGVVDRSVDLVVSYDSLVHAEADVLQGYVRELARVLAPGGAAFIHHSNVGACLDAQGKPTIPNEHWRATTMSADLFAKYCADVGLVCPAQELIAWDGANLMDCISTATRPGSVHDRPHCRIENPRFMNEAERARSLVALYGLGSNEQDPFENPTA
jgi:SAM-dependent methyltransferase